MKKKLLVFAFCFVAFLATNAQTINDGIKLLHYEKNTSGKQLFEKMYLANPKDPKTIYWYGQSFIENDDVKGAANLYKKAGMNNVAVSKTHPFLQDGYCLNVLGEYILEFIYPKAISDYFKMFFSSIHEKKQFNEELFGKIFEMKGDCKITLRRSKKDAEAFKKEIKKYFI